MNEWEEPKEELSLEGMKDFVGEMRELRKAYDAAKKLSNEAHEKYKEAEGKIIGALDSAGLKKFNVPGLGTAYTITKLTVKVPIDLASKRKLFDYMRERQGVDATDNMISINHQTLNAYYKEELEACKAEGKDLKVPGIEDPVERVSLGFRSDKK